MPLTDRSKALYQPWNQEGFTGDPFVRKMTSIQRWIYKTLLQEAFVCSTRPRLPDNDDLLWVLADCENKEQWLENKEPILKMFRKEDGLLFQPRLEEDWQRLISAREGKSEAGRRGAKKRWSKIPDSNVIDTQKAPIAEDAKRSEAIVSEVIVKEEEENMKPDKQIEILTEQFFGKRANLRGWNADELKKLTTIHKGSAVVRAFGEWSAANSDNPDISDPVHSFLREADELLSGGSSAQAALKDPRVLNLTLRLSKASDKKANFGNREKAVLSELLGTYTEDEIVAGFKEWLETQDLNMPKTVQYLGKNFVEVADQRAAMVRMDREEAEAARIQREAVAARLQEQAEAERKEREKANAAEAESFDPLADL